MRDFDSLVATLKDWAGELVTVEVHWRPGNDPGEDPLFNAVGVLGRGKVEQVDHKEFGRMGRATWSLGDSQITVSTEAFFDWDEGDDETVDVRLHEDIVLRLSRAVVPSVLPESLSQPAGDAESAAEPDSDSGD